MSRDLKTPWFYVPPYRNEGHKILNDDGEFVATFEDRPEALKVVSVMNREAKGEQK